MEAVPNVGDLERLLDENEWIAALAVGLMGDVHRAEDLAQDTRLAALQHPLKQASSARPWLATVARNAARLVHRTERTRDAREADRAREAEGLGPSPEDLLANLETQQLVARLVHELPEELSDTLLLSFFEGLSSESIARLRQVPAGTVRWRKKRALELLRERLDAHHGGDRSTWLSALAPLAAQGGRRKAQLATGTGGLAGILAPWIAMSLTWKLTSIAAALVLCSLPFFGGSPGEGPDPASVPESATETVASLPDPDPGPRPLPPALASAEVERVSVELPAEPDPVPTGPLTTRVQLRVVDSLGHPLAGAVVTPSPSSELELSHLGLAEELGPVRIAGLLIEMVRRTGGDGLAHWETELLREPGLVTFHVVGPNYEIGSLSAMLQVGVDVDLEDVLLEPAGAVEGRAFLGGSPAPKYTYISLGAAQLPEGEAGLKRLRKVGLSVTEHSGRCDAAGQFRMTGIPGGEYRLYSPALNGSSCTWSEAFLVTEGMLTSSLEITLGARSTAIPQVLVLGADGEPLMDATVLANGEHITYSGYTDAEGRWEFGSMYSSFVGGKLTVRDNSLVHLEATVEPIPTEPGTVTVRMKLGSNVEHALTVTGTEGRPIEQAEVTVRTNHGSRTWRADEGGLDLLLPAAADFDLHVEAPGFLSRTLQALRAASLPFEWSLELQAIPGVGGMILAGGEPVSRAKVEMHSIRNESQILIKGNSVNRLEKEFTPDRSDKGGEFLIHQPRDGNYALLITAARYADAVVELKDYKGVTGSPDLIIELNKGGALRGTVRDHSGLPVPRACVVLNHPYHRMRRKRANRNGEFSFSRVPVGDWYLHVVPEFDDGGFFTSTMNLEAGWVYPTNCSVLLGQDVHQDVALTDPAGTSVEGRLQVTGGDLGSLKMTLSSGPSMILGGDPFEQEWEESKALRSGEDFAFQIPVDRQYDWELTSPRLPGALRRELNANELPWQGDVHLELATFSAQLKDWSSATTSGSLSLSSVEGDWTFRLTLEADEDGFFGPLLVPAGQLDLRWELGGAAGSDDRVVELSAGEQREFEL